MNPYVNPPLADSVRNNNALLVEMDVQPASGCKRILLQSTVEEYQCTISYSETVNGKNGKGFFLPTANLAKSQCKHFNHGNSG
jgi:hypothetical protein